VQPPPGYEVHRRERGSVSFCRAVGLPSKVKDERATATLRNGVLTVAVEKLEEARATRIAVSAN
jgi:HSP20 family molecular chaperone IbpA